MTATPTTRRLGGVAGAVVVGIAGLVALTLVPPGSAFGQVSDPYATTTTSVAATTSTTTATTPPCPPRIALSAASGTAGSSLTAVASCFPSGARVTFTFNGRAVGQDQATPAGGTAAGALRPLAVVGLRSTRPQATGTTTADLRFNVPSVAPGIYPVCAFADGVSPVCANFRVLAAGTGSGGTLANGLLATTGKGLLLLAGVGSVVLAVGWFLRATARRRRAV